MRLGGILHRLVEPRLLLRAALRRLPGVALDRRIRWDAIAYPPYAYGLYLAAGQARALGLKHLAALEFGVAGGRGLVALERLADEIGAHFGIDVAVYGFDSGEGMPPPQDYRDLPYLWQPGFFAMDRARLDAQLRRAMLVLGDVGETAGGFIETYAPPPIGFIAFDLDYYSSTASALRLLDAAPAAFLPRTLCYFDDCVGDDWELHSHHTGALLAIDEFNERRDDRKLARIHGLRAKRRIPALWNEQMYVLHCFDHLHYNTHVYPDKNWQRPL